MHDWKAVYTRPHRKGRPGALTVVERSDAQRVWGGALDWPRLLWLFLERRSDLATGSAKQARHVVPEACSAAPLSRWFGPCDVALDLRGERVGVCGNVTRLGSRDSSVEILLCDQMAERTRMGFTAASVDIFFCRGGEVSLPRFSPT